MKILPLLLLALLASCSQNAAFTPTIGFYHWQQQLEMDSLNHCLLNKIGSKELHVKVMDIGWQNGRPLPLSRIDTRSVDTAFSIVPVVFITNEVFRNIRGESIEKLANDILAGLDLNVATSLAKSNASLALPVPVSLWSGGKPTEWQIDCDWTKSTQGRYFQFLREFKQLLGEATKLSVTIRLHQFLNQKSQGVPPADRGVLMAYNVGELNDPTAANTILDTSITASYLRPDISYPISLDLALPYYQWGRIYRDGELLYLSNELTADELNDERFNLNADGTYTTLRTTYLRGYSLYSGDMIRLEGSKPKELLSVARQLRIIPGFLGQRLLFYHIGSSMGQTCDDQLIRQIANSVAMR